MGARLVVGSLLLFGCWGSELGNLESRQHDSVTDPVQKQRFDTELRAACGPGGVTADGERAMPRWPYLQKMTDRGLTIMWTARPEEPAARLEITTAGGDPVAELQATADPQSARDAHVQYATAVDGLEPDTIYCYAIRGSSTWLEPTGFRTAPEAGSDTPIEILVMGDLGTRTSDQMAIREQMMNVHFDLVLVAGDLAYEEGTLSEHERNFFEVYREIMMSRPFFVISGNHDYAGDGAVFREVFGLFENGGPDGRERWYSLDWGPVHVAAIDTEITSEAQARWVEADLAASDRPVAIALMHKPLYSSGTHGSSPTLQSLYAGAFERNGVDLVLAGHDHNYERTEPIGGVTYVVTGSAGRGTRPVSASSFTAYSEAVAHFTHLAIEDGRIRINAIDGRGGDFDSAVLEY